MRIGLFMLIELKEWQGYYMKHKLIRIVEDFASVCYDAEKSITPLGVVKSEVDSVTVLKDADYELLYGLIVDEYTDAMINGIPQYECYDLELYTNLIRKYEEELKDAVMNRVPAPGSIVVIITNNDDIAPHYVDVISDVIEFEDYMYFVGIRNKIVVSYSRNDMFPYELYRVDYDNRECTEILTNDIAFQIITTLIEIRARKTIEEMIGHRRLELIEMLNKSRVDIYSLLEEEQKLEGTFYVMGQRI